MVLHDISTPQIFICDYETGSVWVPDEVQADEVRWIGRTQHPPRIHVFGGICSFGDKSPPLIRISGNMDSSDYIRMLDVYKSFIEEHAPDGDVYWCQDGAKVHTTRHNIAKMRSWGWQIVKHSSSSPDLNPQEDVWQKCEMLIRKLGMKPKTVAELTECVREVWRSVAHPNKFHQYMGRLRRNAKTVFVLKGGNRYKENACQKAVQYH